MAERCAHFKIKDFIRPGESYHFAHTELSAEDGVRYHDHDYHEVFWVTHGRGEHRWNGKTRILQPGVLHLIHPSDRHRVAGSKEAPMRIVNLAFPSVCWRVVHRRYFETETDWFELPGEQRAWALSVRAQTGLKLWAERLASTTRPRVLVDGFLMELPNLRPMKPIMQQEPVPDWLLRAQLEIGRPDNFVGGTVAFARLAGRSPSHVSRAALRWLGATPTDIVNTARIDYSAGQLAGTSRPIIEIMLDCGLTNLSHFYALFRKRFGVSPRRYRLQAHPTVRG
ncbi:MAG: helix-turn-helix transcriptional regulator [Cephaloticoccus sp.]|nr:helix-turn-helix transcriptional regulator [Cephaloticoccus sp.]MCF7759151.1 helix-turn-helix transcriptional regulator [Cephaloticoccus sp.]